jgi:hypothetical protein
MEKPMKTSKLPRTDSIQELAKFWDTHDLTDFEGELEEVTEPVFVRGTAELDTAKIDDAVLGLLYLGLHDGARAWKGFDWEAMNRLHERGYITDPRGKAKSVVFTEEGVDRAKRLLEKLFSKQAEPKAAAARDRHPRSRRR